MYRHIIPVNISADGNLFGGLIKKRNAIEACLIALAGILFFKVFLYALPIIIKTALFVVIVLLPAVIALIGIDNQSVVEKIVSIISYKRKPKVYQYNIQTESYIEEPSFLQRLFDKEAKDKAKAEKTRSKGSPSAKASSHPAGRKLTKAEKTANKAAYKAELKAVKRLAKQKR